jgi:hypothetical protein
MVRRLDHDFGRLAERIAPHHHSSHIVQLCSDEAEYAGTVARFFAAGLAAGHAALAVTLTVHREAIIAALASLGCQPECARREGQLVFLDAGDTLLAICADGAPDRARFRRVIGAALCEVSPSATHAAPFVHGEMVDLLCGNGQVDAAQHLEGLWNELGEQRRFHLLCTYTASNFAGVDRTAAYDRICSQHTHVLPSTALCDADDATRLRELARLEQRVRALEAELALPSR